MPAFNSNSYPPPPRVSIFIIDNTISIPSRHSAILVLLKIFQDYNGSCSQNGNTYPANNLHEQSLVLVAPVTVNSIMMHTRHPEQAEGAANVP